MEEKNNLDADMADIANRMNTLRWHTPDEDEPEETASNEELLREVRELRKQIAELRTEMARGYPARTSRRVAEFMPPSRAPTNEPPQSVPEQPPVQRAQNPILPEQNVPVQRTKNPILPEQSEPEPDVPEKSAPPKAKKKFAWVAEVFFYLLLVVLVVGAFFIRSNADGRPILIAGYSAFIVETGSMQAEIPQGSLVVTKSVESDSLKIGDDITFMANPTTTVTHRIIGITENYNDTGQRAFETQGIMNAAPDKNLVPEVNVVGKVVFHNEVVGQMAGFVSSNWPILLFVLVVIVVLVVVLKRIYKD